MELDEACRLVIALAEVGALHDCKNDAEAAEAQIAMERVKGTFRHLYGVEFDGDDALGMIEPSKGDNVIFLPIAVTPYLGRPTIEAPISGMVVDVLASTDCHVHPGFPYFIHLDTKPVMTLWAQRDELQIIAGI